MYALICQQCFEYAFYIKEKPVDGEVVTADMCLKLDMSQPVDNEVMICGSCEQDVNEDNLSIEKVVYVESMSVK